MKTSVLSGFLTLFSFAVGIAEQAMAETAPASPPASSVLALVVVAPLALSEYAGAYSDFDRLDLAFRDIAERRHWPVRIVAERFAANTPAHALELRVFLQPVGSHLPNEFDFRAWMTLNDHGAKHDFGMIVHREIPRPGEDMDDFLERLFHGAAAAAAQKIEPVLFPQLARSKS